MQCPDACQADGWERLCAYLSLARMAAPPVAGAGVAGEVTPPLTAGWVVVAAGRGAGREAAGVRLGVTVGVAGAWAGVGAGVGTGVGACVMVGMVEGVGAEVAGVTAGVGAGVAGALIWADLALAADDPGTRACRMSQHALSPALHMAAYVCFAQAS